MSTETTTPTLFRIWDSRPGILGWLGAVNHKQVGARYIATAIAFFIVGGVQSLIMRIQLGAPDAGVVSPELYNQLFTMHGTTMMFLFAVPITEAVGIYIAPLMLGQRDMPFPRLNAFGYWVYLSGGLMLYSSFLVGAAPDSGWFAYVPLTGPEFSPGLNLDFWLLGVTFVEIAGVVAAIELIVLVLRCRAPGMGLARIPLFVWGSFVTSIMVLFAFPPLIAGSLMLELDRKVGTRFYDAAAGGDPLLWQHIFWWFGHPEVYIILLPAIGIISMVIPTFARTRIVGYTLIAAATVAIGIVSFGLWAHHMYVTGLPLMAMSFFAAGSFLIAIPSGVQVFAWIATIWKGKPEWTLPMRYVVAALVTFVLGGVTGVMVASVPFDSQAHDSYFVVAHFHYVIIGGVVFPLMGGLYYWWPKVMGRLVDERLGNWGFWLTVIGFHLTFMVQHFLGLAGMARRIYTYPEGLGWGLGNLISTVGAVVLAVGLLLAFIALRSRGPAPPDPWRGPTLEWATASPPEPQGFSRIPWVRGRDPLWDDPDLDDWPEEHRALQAELAEPTRWRREIVLTSTFDGRPEQLTTLPAHSLLPLSLAVTAAVLLIAVLIDQWAVMGLAALAAAVQMVAWGWTRQDDAEPADIDLASEVRT